MDVHPDLHDEIEKAIGHGPALPPPAVRLEAGRTALRRRRAMLTAGAGIAVAAVLVPAMALGGGVGTGTQEPPPASPASTSPTVGPSVEPSAKASRPAKDREPRFDPRSGEGAYVDVLSGELMIDPDAVVLQRVDDLYPGKGTESVALDLRIDGQRQWVALEWDRGGSSGTYGTPEDGFYTGWDDFLAKVTSGGGMTSGPPPRGGGGGGGGQPVPGEVTGLSVTGETFASDGTVTILEQQPSPDLPRSFAAPGEETAAAHVEQGGVRFLVLSRPEQLVVVESAGHGSSLEALIDWARQRYVSGEGLL